MREDGLKNGCSRSCGCLIADTAAALLTTHGKTHSPEHYAWKGMRGRCENPNNPRFGSYGARGIAVCERWRESFEAFYADMGPRPTPEHSMDRIDNDGPYSPENCRWATPTEQNRNTSRNHLLTHNGETLCISEWAERTGIRKGAILSRLDRGWSVADALSIL